jgi:catechol 2,3-dioxygenase
MPRSLQLLRLHLRVADLARSLSFYSTQLGFKVLRHADRRAELGTSQDAPGLLELSEDKNAVATGPEAAGLFHGAVLLPDRGALGRWLQFAAATGAEFDGFADHGVSEAVYLSDPDGNGLEFYADRPQADWPRESGKLTMFTRSLGVRELVAASGSVRPNPLAESRWGHLHLRVMDLARSRAFYEAELGVTVMQDSLPGAAFLAADGYHHHLGLNTWGQPRYPKPADALGLVSATFQHPTAGNDRELAAPEGYTLELASIPGTYTA